MTDSWRRLFTGARPAGRGELDRLLRPCPRCAAPVYVLAELCRYCRFLLVVPPLAA